MKNYQGLGWLAAGVLALGLNGFYHDGGLEMAHRVSERFSERSAVVMARASESADELLARADLVSAREQAQSCRLAAAAEHLRARMVRTENARMADGVARFEKMSARQEAQMAANRARVEAQAERFRFATFSPIMVKLPQMPAVCPRVRVVVPQPRIDVSVPSLRIDTGVPGPI